MSKKNNKLGQPKAMNVEIQHQIIPPKGSFFIREGGKKQALITYSMAGSNLLIIDHTEVSASLRGTGAGKQLVLAVVNYAREEGLKVLPLCPFAKSVFDKERSIWDVLQ